MLGHCTYLLRVLERHVETIFCVLQNIILRLFFEYFYEESPFFEYFYEKSPKLNLVNIPVWVSQSYEKPFHEESEQKNVKS